MNGINVVLGIGGLLLLIISEIADFFGIPLGMSLGGLVYFGWVVGLLLISRKLDDAPFIQALLPMLTYLGFIPIINVHYNLGSGVHSLFIIFLMVAPYSVVFYKASRY